MEKINSVLICMKSNQLLKKHNIKLHYQQLTKTSTGCEHLDIKIGRSLLLSSSFQIRSLDLFCFTNKLLNVLHFSSYSNMNVTFFEKNHCASYFSSQFFQASQFLHLFTFNPFKDQFLMFRVIVLSPLFVFISCSYIPQLGELTVLLSPVSFSFKVHAIIPHAA